ncbi:MAG: hypothetical protein K2O69_01370 [Odoribacter sp.]|nr:hypothetical protein [Odoribacter sp.]
MFCHGLGYFIPYKYNDLKWFILTISSLLYYLLSLTLPYHCRVTSVSQPFANGCDVLSIACCERCILEGEWRTWRVEREGGEPAAGFLRTSGRK